MSITIVVCLIASPLLGNNIQGTNDIDTFLTAMFNYAKAHNLRALEGLRGEVKLKNDRTLTNAYSLALYIASPNKYEQHYVMGFPVDYDGIMHDLYERIELKRLTPKFLYSIESIGLIAQGGNEKAIEKVLQGNIHSDGVVAELFCDILIKLFEKQPQKTLRAFSQIDKEQRQKNYLCFKVLNLKEFTSLKTKIKKVKLKASKLELTVIQEIEKYE